MDIIEIEDINAPELSIFSSLTEAQLQQAGRAEGGEGLFIVESPKVISTALQAGYEPVSLLCERKHITGDAAQIIAAADIPVYTADRSVLASLTGYTLTRGVLCAMRRREVPRLEDVCKGTRRVAVLDGVVDSTNVGAIFRAAAALGMDAVLLTPQCCEPYNRRVVRVSMGTVFQVPWTVVSNPVDDLRRLGFATAAMALRSDSVDIDDTRLNAEPRLAIILGSEGHGLPPEVIDAADYTVCIPMAHGVDSLNVACAASIAFWQVRKKL